MKLGWFSALLLLATTGLAYAQGTASINGRVVDQTGAVVPGATVTVTHVATGVKRFTVTNAEGLYNLPALESGIYEVTTDLTGFAQVVRRDVTVTVGGTITVDITLNPAGVS